MRGLRFSIFLWFVTIVAVLCLKLPTVEVEEPSPVVEVVEVVTPEPEPEVAPQPWTDEEVIVLAKMLWGEARGVSSDTGKAACVWCALNRVDHGYGDIITVVTTPKQFVGYNEENPVDDGLITLCIDVLTRWYAEREKVRLRSVVSSLRITCGSLAMAREITSATPTVAVIDGIGLYRVRMKAEVSL